MKATDVPRAVELIKERDALQVWMDKPVKAELDLTSFSGHAALKLTIEQARLFAEQEIAKLTSKLVEIGVED